MYFCLFLSYYHQIIWKLPILGSQSEEKAAALQTRTGQFAEETDGRKANSERAPRITAQEEKRKQSAA